MQQGQRKNADHAYTDDEEQESPGTTALLMTMHASVDTVCPLHKVVLNSVSIYKGVIQQHQTYISSNYGTSAVVFDGYNEGPVIKDHEHERRMMKSTGSPDVYVKRTINPTLVRVPSSQTISQQAEPN